MDISLTTEVMAIFVIFWPILAKIWLPWQRPLDPCNQKCIFLIGRPRKPSVISNHILPISHTDAFICIYSNFSPKIGCHGNAPLSLAYGSVKDEFSDGTNPISNPNSVWICRLELKLWPFLWFLGPILAKIWLPWQRPLDPCNHKCLLRIGRPQKPYPRIKNFVNSCYTRKLCRFEGSRQV